MKNDDTHIQYFCFAGITRSVMAQNLSQQLAPELTFSSTGVWAKACWDLNRDERIEYITKTALQFVSDPKNDFAYEGGTQLRDIVEQKISEFSIDSLDMERFASDATYGANIRAGLQSILKNGLAPNEVMLRNFVLREYGLTHTHDHNIQLRGHEDINLYLGMTPQLVEDADEIVGVGKSYFIADYANTQLSEPGGNLFAIGCVAPYLDYAKQLHDTVLPNVIEKATSGGPL